MKNNSQFICFNHDYVLSLHRILLQRYKKIILICKKMADFYVKYGSRGAQLKASYSCGNVKIKLHIVGSCHFVLSKNRKIIYSTLELPKALAAFHNLIYMEAPDLFNSKF